jgi:DNA-binding NarL/FixJ family response regulator
VATAAKAIEAAERERPDVCLLDIHMPGSGIRATSEILQRVPETVVVMLTVSRDDADLFDALLAGASGYLLKDIEPDHLPGALRGAIAGESPLPPTLVARVLEEFRTREGRRRTTALGRTPARLTSREHEVLQLMLEDLSTAEIARRLFVSDVTVRTHIANVLKKLRVPDRAAARELFQDH